MSPASKWPAACALIIAMFGWSIPPVTIRFLRDAYDPFTHALLRYGIGAAALLVVSLIGLRPELSQAFRRSRPIIALAFVLVGQQVCWTMACYGTTPVVSQLTTKLSVILIILLSFVLFHEERAVIKSPLYLLGTLFSFLGVAAVLMRGSEPFVPVIDRYALLLFMTAGFWAVYVVWAKHLVTDLHPVAMFALLALYTSIGLAALSIAFGHPGGMLTAGPRNTIIVLLSGLIPIATAHPSYHYAQRHLGSALCSSVNLLNPLGTYLLALIVFPDDHLSLTQWLGAAVLLAGTLLVTYAARRTRNAQALSPENGVKELPV